MNHQVYLLVFLLLFSLALLCALCWLHHDPPQLREAAKVRTRLHRLLKPRSPDDCPACRLASPASSVVGPVPVPVRPWSEVKSRQGVLLLVVVDNSSFSPTGLTAQMTLRILATQAMVSMLPIFNSEDSDGASCVHVCVPARGLSPALSRAALAS